VVAHVEDVHEESGRYTLRYHSGPYDHYDGPDGPGNVKIKEFFGLDTEFVEVDRAFISVDASKMF
jgi:hypothetical protein